MSLCKLWELGWTGRPGMLWFMGIWLTGWTELPSNLKELFSFACQIKLSCNQAVTLVRPSLQIVVAVRQNQGNYKLPHHLLFHFLDLTWLKQPWLGPLKVEAKHSRSPTWLKLLWWKLNVRKTKCNGSDNKPSMLDMGTAKTNLAESSCSSVSDSKRPLVKVGGLTLLSGRTYG